MHWKNKDSNIKNNQLASKYNVSESTVSEILKKSDYFLSLNPNQFTANSYHERLGGPISYVLRYMGGALGKPGFE